MKLEAKIVRYSSVVGGGITLHDETGAARFMVMLRGTTQGISKEETEVLSVRLNNLINTYGVFLPDTDHA